MTGKPPAVAVVASARSSSVTWLRYQLGAHRLDDDGAEEAGVDLPAVPFAAGRGAQAVQHVLALALGIQGVGGVLADVGQAVGVGADEEPSSAMLLTSCMPSACTDAQRVAGCSSSTWLELSKFWKWICKQSPTFIRSTIGRGRLPGRSWTWPGASSEPLELGTTSLRRANIIPCGCTAPRRFQKKTWSMATTSAWRVRLQVWAEARLGRVEKMRMSRRVRRRSLHDNIRWTS